MTDELKSPKTIYLQWDADPLAEVTWSEDKINADDVCYTRTRNNNARIVELQSQLATRDADLARAMRYITGLEKSVPENNLAVARLSLALVDAKTLIERLIEAGWEMRAGAGMSGDNVYLRKYVKNWRAVVSEYRATVSKKDSVGKESVE